LPQHVLCCTCEIRQAIWCIASLGI
jgi:hypothetical protein